MLMWNWNSFVGILGSWLSRSKVFSSCFHAVTQSFLRTWWVGFLCRISGSYVLVDFFARASPRTIHIQRFKYKYGATILRWSCVYPVLCVIPSKFRCGFALPRLISVSLYDSSDWFIRFKRYLVGLESATISNHEIRMRWVAKNLKSKLCCHYFIFEPYELVELQYTSVASELFEEKPKAQSTVIPLVNPLKTA